MMQSLLVTTLFCNFTSKFTESIIQYHSISFTTMQFSHNFTRFQSLFLFWLTVTIPTFGHPVPVRVRAGSGSGARCSSKGANCAFWPGSGMTRTKNVGVHQCLSNGNDDWLVVYPPLWKTSVSWDDFPLYGKSKKSCSKAPSRWLHGIYHDL